jgi:hypothetical protein
VAALAVALKFHPKHAKKEKNKTKNDKFYMWQLGYKIFWKDVGKQCNLICRCCLWETGGIKVSWIVIRFEKYGRKISWIVIRYGNMEEN